jgi:hypothetical protein
MTSRDKIMLRTCGERIFIQWERSKVLRSLPVAVLVIIAALDRADMALLGASFPMLEKTLGVHGTFGFGRYRRDGRAFILSSQIHLRFS